VVDTSAFPGKVKVLGGGCGRALKGKSCCGMISSCFRVHDVEACAAKIPLAGRFEIVDCSFCEGLVFPMIFGRKLSCLPNCPAENIRKPVTPLATLLARHVTIIFHRDDGIGQRPMKREIVLKVPIRD
jgi:hypothetical protein